MADDLEKYLESLPDKLVDELSGAIREEAERLSAAQRARLKQLETSPDETGHLEESCTVIPGDNPLEWIVVAGGDLTMKEVREGSGTDYDYAEAFEHGTSKQPARSFFYSTYNEMKDEMQENINEAINEVLE